MQIAKLGFVYKVKKALHIYSLVLLYIIICSVLVFEQGLSVTCASTCEPLKVMISGAPASGKGTQCELIVQKVIISYYV